MNKSISSEKMYRIEITRLKFFPIWKFSKNTFFSTFLNFEAWYTSEQECATTIHMFFR